MKVVLFCGGLGMRMRDYTEIVPKPMVTIGNKPILWYLMKYYAHFGYKDFILCLGYKSEVIKRFFLEYKEAVANDFVFSQGGNRIQLLNTDIQDWKITFVDTGLASNIGQRLMAVKNYLQGQDIFLANYSDGLTDLHLPKMLAYFRGQNRTACLLSVRSSQRFHVVEAAKNGLVTNIKNIGQSNLRINGGFYILKNDIFDHLKKGEDLVDEPFMRLIKKKQLSAYAYDGFWAAMDTFKDRQFFEEIYSRGETPWEVWIKK
jgi:glucose-1-phosphate cytidylyltransferase